MKSETKTNEKSRKMVSSEQRTSTVPDEHDVQASKWLSIHKTPRREWQLLRSNRLSSKNQP